MVGSWESHIAVGGLGGHSFMPRAGILLTDPKIHFSYMTCSALVDNRQQAVAIRAYTYYTETLGYFHLVCLLPYNARQDYKEAFLILHNLQVY